MISKGFLGAVSQLLVSKQCASHAVDCLDWPGFPVHELVQGLVQMRHNSVLPPILATASYVNSTFELLPSELIWRRPLI